MLREHLFGNYYFFYELDDLEEPHVEHDGCIMIKDNHGDAYMPPYEGKYTALEECKTSEALDLAIAWENEKTGGKNDES